MAKGIFERLRIGKRLRELEREVGELRELIELSGSVDTKVEKTGEVDVFGEPIKRGKDGKRVASAMDEAFCFPDELDGMDIEHDGKAVSS